MNKITDLKEWKKKHANEFSASRNQIYLKPYQQEYMIELLKKSWRKSKDEDKRV